MKRLIPVAIAIILSISLGSCGKLEYTCSCKITDGSPTPIYEEVGLGKITNNSAQKKCNNHQLSRAKELLPENKVIQCRVAE
jgi:hypothetical protein